jgi:hypothetical protein
MLVTHSSCAHKREPVAATVQSGPWLSGTRKIHGVAHVERSQRSVAIVWLQLALGISRLDAIRQCVTAFANQMMATAPIGAESRDSSRSTFATGRSFGFGRTVAATVRRSSL